MISSSMQLLLLLNLQPASAAILQRLDQVEISRKDDAPSTIEVGFHADRARGPSSDYSLLSESSLMPSGRITVAVSMGGTPTVLFDGYITKHAVSHSKQFGGTTINVSGEDVSIMMDRIDISTEYPQMPDALIALAVMAKYSMLLDPMVVPPIVELIPLLVESVPQQNGTDRGYLASLASTYGYIFHVRPGPEIGSNVGYWGPPPREGSVNRALSVDQGPDTNVDSLSFQFDSLAPVQMFGMVQDDATEVDAPLATFFSTRTPVFATDQALDPFNLLLRRVAITEQRYGYARALIDAQSKTDVSTDRAVTGQGELDTMRYGDILSVPGLVDVRGAGNSYDGRYYIPSVTHTIRRGSYRQSFTLAREGTGSTVSQVTP